MNNEFFEDFGTSSDDLDYGKIAMIAYGFPDDYHNDDCIHKAFTKAANSILSQSQSNLYLGKLLHALTDIESQMSIPEYNELINKAAEVYHYEKDLR